MSKETRIVLPGPQVRSVRTANGEVLHPPEDWDLLPPGDAGLTRRVKAAGPTWTVQERRGRKIFSQGVWAPRATIESARAELAAERATPAYTRRREADVRRRRARPRRLRRGLPRRRGRLPGLRCPPCRAGRPAGRRRHPPCHAGRQRHRRPHQAHPHRRRAEAAVIAWLRHQTTAYDQMTIPRVKGMRREVRRMLAERSRQVLHRYRRGEDIDATCPLQRAVSG